MLKYIFRIRKNDTKTSLKRVQSNGQLFAMTFIFPYPGRSSSPCNIDNPDTRSESKWRHRSEKSKEISVDDLINNMPSMWQMQGNTFNPK